MIFADKIIEERKKLEMSQEELAEHLNVSRQSVSKWESAQSIPDINRIIQMAELFGVSTDYLLKDDARRDNEKLDEDYEERSDDTVKVSMEEAASYLNAKEKTAPIVAFGVSLCVFCSAPLQWLCAATAIGMSKKTAVSLGIVFLLLLVAAAVFIFIRSSKDTEKYNYLEIKELETAYGVDGMTREKKDNFSSRYNLMTAIGVILCIIGPALLTAAAVITENEAVSTAMVGVLLTIIAVAVYLFVSTGIIKGSYDVLLQQGDYTLDKKKHAKTFGRISSIYWLSTTAIYLAISFISGSWDRSWIVWPVAGVMFGVVMVITKMVIGAED